MRRDHTESARLDNFVDGAFAFAVTMLVINGASIPHDIPSLLRALGGVPAFACCFAQLAVFWHGHVRWRDQTQLTDRGSLVLSLLLVFFALIFVYPLHMVFASLFHSISGGILPMDFSIDSHSMHGVKMLFVSYGLAYTCMAGTLALLFRHGSRHGTQLSAAERVELGAAMVAWAFSAVIALLSTLIAAFTPNTPSALASWQITAAGFCYGLLFLIGPLARRYRRQHAT